MIETCALVRRLWIVQAARLEILALRQNYEVTSLEIRDCGVDLLDTASAFKTRRGGQRSSDRIFAFDLIQIRGIDRRGQ